LDGSGIEPFALRWELDALLRLGTSLTGVAKSYAWEGAKTEIVRHTLLGALYAGLWPLGLLRMASVLDNPFSVAVSRSDKAGKVLAHALISRAQGERPVTLVGYSLGARVIYSCLLELAEQNAFGLIESAVMMGSPTPSSSSAWRRARAVVSARVVNIYSKEDYILGFLYRTSKAQLGVAGLQEVEGVHGVENVDMSELVTGHNKYRYLVGTVLRQIGFEDLDATQIKEQVIALKEVERKEQEAKEHDKLQTERMSKEQLPRHATESTSSESKEPLPWETTDHDSRRRPVLEQSSSSRTVVPSGSHPATTKVGAPNDSSEDESENGHIVMIDMEEDDPPSLPKRQPTMQAKAVLVQETETLTLTPINEQSNTYSESDTESVTSGALGEMVEVEPLPEPEPENERVQFRSSV
jgi:hypothetical protein